MLAPVRITGSVHSSIVVSWFTIEPLAKYHKKRGLVTVPGSQGSDFGDQPIICNRRLLSENSRLTRQL